MQSLLGRPGPLPLARARLKGHRGTLPQLPDPRHGRNRGVQCGRATGSGLKNQKWRLTATASLILNRRMARPLRINRLGAWHHVSARGTERKEIFREDRDRRHWLELLPEFVHTYRLRLHAYVMMENHYHLLVESKEGNLSQAMQWLQTSYSMWFNRKYGRVGPLFQGRFKSVLVEPSGWGLALSRYVHLNPVRIKTLGLDKGARAADRLGARREADGRMVRERLKKLREFPW